MYEPIKIYPKRPIATEGIYPYMGCELPTDMTGCVDGIKIDPNKTYYIYNSKSLLQSVIDSGQLDNKPITLDHEFVDANQDANTKKVGHISSRSSVVEYVSDANKIVSDLVIDDVDAQRTIRKNVKGLSLGYTQVLKSNTVKDNYNGKVFDFARTEIPTINHLALVKNPVLESMLK